MRSKGKMTANANQLVPLTRDDGRGNRPRCRQASGGAPKNNTTTIQVAIAPLLVGAETVGRMLGVSRRTVLNWHQDGTLGPLPIKLGRRILWRADELARWVATGCPDRKTWSDLLTSGENVL